MLEPVRGHYSRGSLSCQHAHWQVFLCQAAGLGVEEVELETKPTDFKVGSTGAAGPGGPAPDLLHQPPCRRIFIVKKVAIGIY